MLGAAGCLGVEALGQGNWYDAPLWVSILWDCSNEQQQHTAVAARSFTTGWCSCQHNQHAQLVNTSTCCTASQSSSLLRQPLCVSAAAKVFGAWLVPRSAACGRMGGDDGSRTCQAAVSCCKWSVGMSIFSGVTCLWLSWSDAGLHVLLLLLCCRPSTVAPPPGSASQCLLTSTPCWAL